MDSLLARRLSTFLEFTSAKSNPGPPSGTRPWRSPGGRRALIQERKRITTASFAKNRTKSTQLAVMFGIRFQREMKIT